MKPDEHMVIDFNKPISELTDEECEYLTKKLGVNPKNEMKFYESISDTLK